MVFGSCRVAAPHVPPYSLRKDEDPRGREIDALHTLAQRMRNEPREDWPDVLLMIGDQVYADEVSPFTRSFIESTRDPDHDAGDRVVDFEEYTELYRESWGDPTIRWLLSTVSTAMIFDDHDVHDDWNISAAWLEEMRGKAWWNRHILGALASYWVYQHLGNLAPGAHQEDELLKRVKAADDAEPILEEFARRADRESSGTRWSFCRDLGNTRVVVVDSRAGRQLEEGNRSMLDDAEWDWLEEHVSGDFDHVLIATSLPWLLGPRHALRRGLERGRGRRQPGASRSCRWPSVCARRSTSSTGPPSGSRSCAWRRSSARWPRASAAARPPRWWCCRATCTTPTCSRSPTGAARACRPTCGRPSARPTATRSSRKRAAGDPAGHVAPLRGGLARRWPARPACRTRPCAGA